MGHLFQDADGAVYDVFALIDRVNMHHGEGKKAVMVPLTQLQDQLLEPVWRHWEEVRVPDGSVRQVEAYHSPLQVFAEPAKYAEDYERALAADVSCPICMKPDGRIIDGYHRCLAALIRGMDCIAAYLIPQHVLGDCLRRHMTRSDWAKSRVVSQLFAGLQSGVRTKPPAPAANGGHA